MISRFWVTSLLCVLLSSAVACSDDVADDATVVDLPVDRSGGDSSLDLRDLGPGDGVDGGGDGAEDGPAGDLPAADVAPDTLPPPPNERCFAPTVVTLETSGPTEIVGSTAGASDEFAQVACGGALGPWSGPQVYYRVALEQDAHYLLSLEAAFDAAFYAFPADTECKRQTIDAACKNAGDDPLNVLNSDHLGGREQLLLHPATSGDWIVVVDSWAADVGGAFTITVDSYIPPTNSACGEPQALTLGTPVVGTTLGAPSSLDDVTCGNVKGPWHGGQVYYAVTLQQDSDYRVDLVADFDAALYAFPAAVGCQPSAVDAACEPPPPADPRDRWSSDEASGPGGEQLRIRAEETASWIIVVDGTGVAGTFELGVVSYEIADNDACAAPQALPLTDGSGAVVGDTTGVDDEHASVSCGNPAGPWSGPQLYYEVSLEQGELYEVRLSAAFDASIYAFPATTGCDAGAIDAACSDPTPADPQRLFNSDAVGSGQELLRLAPTTSGNWLLVVDSWSPAVAGDFALTVERYVVPANSSCATPEAVALPASPVAVAADTRLPGASDEFSALTCGNPNGPWPGPQLYYAFDLEAGKTYTVTLTPDGWDAALYAFPAGTGCTAAEVEAACSGHSSDALGDGVVEQLTLSPSAAETWIVAVDSYSSAAPGGAGAFTLEVAWP